jgi:hypothetical protein
LFNNRAKKKPAFYAGLRTLLLDVVCIVTGGRRAIEYRPVWPLFPWPEPIHIYVLPPKLPPRQLVKDACCLMHASRSYALTFAVCVFSSVAVQLRSVPRWHYARCPWRAPARVSQVGVCHWNSRKCPSSVALRVDDGCPCPLVDVFKGRAAGADSAPGPNDFGCEECFRVFIELGIVDRPQGKT